MSELAVFDDSTIASDIDRDLETIAGTNSRIVSTFVGTDFETNKKIFKAVSSAEPLKEHLGEKIQLAHWLAQEVTYSPETVDQNGNQVKGAPQQGIRVVIVDNKGKAYACVSDGVNKALGNIAMTCGTPDKWPDGATIEVVAKMVRGRNGWEFMTLQMI